ncbi:BTAD domain-containing putative transcriptional regulator [Streptomyces sp. TRM64462]|uniref:BTAD domain-containing putative transcriptional regulator n=1 Tax=Streptomyces sp. TRM64462 TaxID=2741726 RepID=UPI001586065D|nr:BTAD domain-containing putative transcriptional regulator [Streptomyces sp. TRM64462]
MEFRLLGPLEVDGSDGPVPLGGTRQRATLAYLLLHANQVVPTRRLLTAMWADDPVPDTARKILQNAVWRLRRTLDAPADAPEHTPRLVTRAPGYLLRVPPERVDLMRFQRLAAQGRAAFAAGAAEEARGVLREALGLWRGPVLADLAEEGTVWPELATLEQRRLDIMEDRFEVELLCGGHQSVLRELEDFVREEPLRERASQQLMLALYRCGRQADALGVYARIRAALVEGLGLEPGRQMQRLQQAILAQDLDLDVRPGAAPGPGGKPAPRPVELTPAPPQAPAPAPAPAPAAAAAPSVPETTDEEKPEGGGADDDPWRETYRDATVLMLRFGVGSEFDDLPAGDIDRVLDTVSRLAREKIDACGGVVATSIGSILLGLFERTSDRDDSAERAVRAASAVRDCLSVPAGPLAPPAPVVQGLYVHAAVTTGVAVVCHWPAPEGRTAPPWVGGDLVERCAEMLVPAPPGEVQVCDETRRRTEAAISYHRVRTAPAQWQVRSVHRVPDHDIAGPGLHRASELELMTGFLDRARQRSMPHLVTVLGHSTLGRTRLLMEFHRRITRDPGAAPPRVLTGAVPGSGDVLSVPADMLAAHCGITADDVRPDAERKLAAALAGLADAETAEALLPALGRLVSRSSDEDPRPLLDAWRRFVALMARTGPLVLIWDELHRADDALLTAIEQLCADCHDAPLLNVVGAHDSLAARRPAWARGLQHTMTLRLAPVAVEALDQLLHSLFTPDSSAA